MRFSAIAFVAVLSSVAAARKLSARQLGSLPTCAQSCVTGSFAGCQSLDIACICGNTNLISELSCCVSKACNAADTETTIQFAQQLCATYQISVPTAAGCTGVAASTDGSAAASSASASSGSVASNAASTTPAGSSAASSTGARSSSASSTSSASAASQSTGAAALNNIGSAMGVCAAAVAGLAAVL